MAKKEALDGIELKGIPTDKTRFAARTLTVSTENGIASIPQHSWDVGDLDAIN